jgi:hypothetical protein
MPLLAQHIIVLCLVAACCALIGWQGFRTLAGKGSKLGSCCSKGCGEATKDSQAAPKTHFIPVESLGRRKDR